MQFLYAIENGSMVTGEMIKASGLSHAFDEDIDITQGSIESGGPNNGKCVIFSAGQANKCRYKPAAQSWQKSNNGKFWLGVYNDDRPRPEELAVSVQLAGHWVKLEDGNKWLVPVARQIVGGSALPKSLVLGANGEVVEKQLPKYAGFWSRVEKLWNDFLVTNKMEKDGKIQLTMAQRMQLAAEALGFNYRIGIDEINMLSMLTTQNMSKIEAAIIDIETAVLIMKELNKKKDAQIKDGSTTSSGSGG